MNKICLYSLYIPLSALMFRNENWSNLIFFLAWHMIESLLYKDKYKTVQPALPSVLLFETDIPLACWYSLSFEILLSS